MTKRRAEAFQLLAALALCVSVAALYVGPIAAGEAEPKAEPKSEPLLTYTPKEHARCRLS